MQIFPGSGWVSAVVLWDMGVVHGVPISPGQASERVPTETTKGNASGSQSNPFPLAQYGVRSGSDSQLPATTTIPSKDVATTIDVCLFVMDASPARVMP
jgi:hypothetical protein